VVGQRSVVLETDDKATVAELVAALVKRWSGLSELLPSIVLSLNLEYIAHTSVTKLKDNDEIAFIPPLSGG